MVRPGGVPEPVLAALATRNAERGTAGSRDRGSEADAPFFRPQESCIAPAGANRGGVQSTGGWHAPANIRRASGAEASRGTQIRLSPITCASAPDHTHHPSHAPSGSRSIHHTHHLARGASITRTIWLAHELDAATATCTGGATDNSRSAQATGSSRPLSCAPEGCRNRCSQPWRRETRSAGPPDPGLEDRKQMRRFSDRRGLASPLPGRIEGGCSQPVVGTHRLISDAPPALKSDAERKSVCPRSRARPPPITRTIRHTHHLARGASSTRTIWLAEHPSHVPSGSRSIRHTHHLARGASITRAIRLAEDSTPQRRPAPEVQRIIAGRRKPPDLPDHYRAANRGGVQSTGGWHAPANIRRASGAEDRHPVRPSCVKKQQPR